MTFSELLYECYSIGLYNSKHHPTNTNVSPTNGPEARCSCEIGYRLLLRYYTDGPWCPITVFFSAALFLPPLFELMLFPNLQDDSYAFKIPLTSILILGCHKDICKKPQLYNLFLSTSNPYANTLQIYATSIYYNMCYMLRFIIVSNTHLIFFMRPECQI